MHHVRILKYRPMLFLLMMILLGCGPQKSGEKPVHEVTTNDTNAIDSAVDLRDANVDALFTDSSATESIDEKSDEGEAEDSKSINTNGTSDNSGPIKKIEPEEVEKKPVEVEVKDSTIDSNPPEQVAPPANAVVEVSHEKWDRLLKKYVSAEGMVDYKGLKGAEAQLDEYLQELSQYSLKGTESRNFAMAYWINAYNAFTVKLILDHYPVKSIMSIKGGKAWDHKWIDLGGQTYSLNQIEHQILRKDYPDARIHFAVNCAAISCPPLLNKAWTEHNLEQYLEQQTRSYINDTDHNQIAQDKIRLSKIFEWYREDFGDLREYIQRYSSTAIATDAKIKFNNYDWGLNGR